MFNKTHYVIQETLQSKVTLTTTYSIKDANGRLLGYIKNRKLKLNFWIEGTDGTRLGETRHVTFRQKKRLLGRYEVYDAQDRLLSIIRSLERTAPTEWLINNPRDQQLAIGRRSSGMSELAAGRRSYQILANDGSIIAEINRKRDLLLRNSYSIDITSQSLDPLIIISYAHIMISSIA